MINLIDFIEAMTGEPLPPHLVAVTRIVEQIDQHPRPLVVHYHPESPRLWAQAHWRKRHGEVQALLA